MTRFDVLVDNGSYCRPSTYCVHEVIGVGLMGATFSAAITFQDNSPCEYYLAFKDITRLSFREPPDEDAFTELERAFFTKLGYLS